MLLHKPAGQPLPQGAAVEPMGVDQRGADVHGAWQLLAGTDGLPVQKGKWRKNGSRCPIESLGLHRLRSPRASAPLAPRHRLCSWTTHDLGPRA